MSEQSGKKMYRTPHLIDLGQGLAAEERIKRWATEQGSLAAEADSILKKLRAALAASRRTEVDERLDTRD